MQARKFSTGTTVVLILFHAGWAAAQPSPGSLDFTFGGTGTSRIGFGGGQAYAYAATVQNDGKLLLAGYTYSNNIYDFALVRFDTNNALDTSFGVGGKVVTQLSLFPSYEGVKAIKVQADGKIVAAGFAQDGTNDSCVVARFNSDGSFDTSFGVNGKVFTDFGSQSAFSSLVIQADGKIVAAGYYVSLLGGYDFLLARYQTNGALDPSFGNGGTIDTPSVGGAYALLIEADGKLVAAGNSFYGTNFNSEFAVLCYTTNGVLDTSFGGTGEVFTQLTGSDYAYAIGYQLGNNSVSNPDKLVVAGYSTDGNFLVARYNLNGSLDTSFASVGAISDSFGPGQSYGLALLVQGFSVRPRLITVGGFVGSGTNYFALARYTAAGLPDTTFGGGTGKVRLQVGPGQDDEAYAITLQAGELVLGGFSGRIAGTGNSDFAAARFNSDGTLDTNFGSGGVVLADIADTFCEGNGVAIQPDGKIVVAGDWMGNAFALARYNSNGSLDESFGVNGGKIKTQVGPSNAVANAVLIQPDGKIVAAGYSFSGFGNTFAAARYNPDGSLDPSFGTAGQVTTPGGIARALAIQPDGRLVLAGYGYNGTHNIFITARYATNGMLDLSFGGSGEVTTSIAGGEDQAWAVAIQPGGKIVVAGQGQVGTSTEFAMVRYLPNGSLDTTFGTFGRVATSFAGGTSALGLAMALQPDGRLIIGGRVATNGIDYVALARYQTNGVLDPSFGSGGEVITQVGIVNDFAASLALEPNGKIIVGGASQQGADYTYAILRYNTDGSLDTGFGFGGKVIVSFGDGGSDLGNAVALDQIGRPVVIGNANDLFGVLRLASEPFLKITSINILTNGQALLAGVGVPATNNTLRSSVNLSPLTFSTLAPLTTDAGGFWQYLDPTAAALPMQFYRLSFP